MKGKLFGFFITLILACLLFFAGMDSRVAGSPIEVYQVYLHGEKIGLISSKDELLNLIDTEQSEIKTKYNVDKVYPPNGLEIKKIYTYSDNIVDENTIYNTIKDIDPFTIEGYTVTITYTEKIIRNDGEILDPGKPVNIHILEKDLIKEALYNTATAFIGSESLANYNAGTQSEIVETGEIINSVYFQETIMVKKDLISTEEYIFKDVENLSQYLLYGTLEKQKTYVTKEGENLDAIADANHLNIEELLIANPQYSSADILLAAGEEVNVGLINPLINVVYRKTVVSDQKIAYKTEYIKDNTKFADYEEVTTKGQDGVVRITQDIRYINGEIQSLAMSNQTVIKNAINKVVTRGTKKLWNGYYYHETQQGNNDWSWPTISPFYITSRFKWRWGRQHNGIDIAAGGIGAPVYAVKEGTVYRVNHNKNLSEGLSVYIQHDNGKITVYMHLSKILVSEGQRVKREQRIALLGNTGASTGPHLHLGVYEGKPYQGGKALDPCNSIFSC